MILTITTAENGRSLEDILRGRGFSKRLITKLKRTDNGMTRSGKLIRTIDIVTAGEKSRSVKQTAKPLSQTAIFTPISFTRMGNVWCSQTAFMPCHPSIKHQGDTLGNLFAGLYPDLTFRPVNRLDRNTSGCVLVAKASGAHSLSSKALKKPISA